MILNNIAKELDSMKLEPNVLAATQKWNEMKKTEKEKYEQASRNYAVHTFNKVIKKYKKHYLSGLEHCGQEFEYYKNLPTYGFWGDTKLDKYIFFKTFIEIAKLNGFNQGIARNDEYYLYSERFTIMLYKDYPYDGPMMLTTTDFGITIREKKS